MSVEEEPAKEARLPLVPAPSPAAEAAEASYRAIFNQAAVGITRVAPDGAFIEVNDRFCLITGYSRSELLDSNFPKITHPDDLGPDLAHVAALLAGERATYSMEKRYIHKAGHPVWVNLTVSLVRKPDGAPDYFISLVEDISERKRVEAQQRRLMELLEHSGDMIALTDPDGRLVHMNRGARRMLGLEDADLKTVNAGAYLPPASIDLLRNVVIPTVRERGLWQGEIELINRKTGRTLEVDDSTFAIRDAHGVLTGFGAVARDVTALKAAAAAEQARAEEFHTLADNIPTLCWMAHADGHIYWFNRRWYEYTGMSPESQAGWGWESVHDPAVLPIVQERWRRSLETGEPFEMTFPLRRRDGVFRPFLTRIVPIRDEAGRIVRWFGANTDITEHQQHEEHLRLLVNELNHRVKNTLATVQSMAAQTLRGAIDPAEAFAKLEARLIGLSAAHNILTERNWEGARLAEVAERTIRAFAADGPDRVRLAGPEVWLPPQTALALSLAFHELATNAVKYGALSDARGRVDVGWTFAPDGRTLSITWTESGGPAVVPPERRGFGSRLIEKNLARELGAPASLTFDPAGLVCRIGLVLPAA